MVKHKSYSEWAKVAKEKGIDASTFHARVNKLGWDIEKAATTKITEFSHKKYTDLADKNNIPRTVYYSRFHNGWSPYRAATTPVQTKHTKKRKNSFTDMKTVEKIKEYINFNPMMSRKEALRRIDELEKQRTFATKEELKEIDKKIFELGKQLIIPRRQRKLKRIVEKGKYMTAEDIKYLKTQGVSVSAICKLMDIPKTSFYKHVNSLLGDAV